MKTLLGFLLTAFLCSASFSGFGQCSGRYYDKVFLEPDVFIDIAGIPIPDIFTGKLAAYNVNYGHVDGRDLDMYLFEPQGDTASKRPLIVLAYGGSFTAGAKESPDIVKLCQQFTAMGYVTASIDYRLLPSNLPIDSANMLKQVIKAVQDSKAAIRFFYKDAATTNTYRIDTNKIFMGGTSAGAFIGVHLGYVTDTANLQQWMKDIIASQGDLEGNSGNPGYSSRIQGIINLAGAIGDSSWIEPGEVPMVSMHGDQDGTVPYCSEIINVSGNDLLVVDGSATIKSRTSHLGIYNPFYTWRNADHVPYVDPTPSSEGPAYMDTTVWFVRDFLFKMMTGVTCGDDLAAKGNVAEPCGPPDTTTTSIASIATDLYRIYPNPSNDVINVEISSSEGPSDVKIYDSVGKLRKSFHGVTEKLALAKSEYGEGVFIVVIDGDRKGSETIRSKIILQ